MIDLEMIQAMRAMMKEELEPINKRLDAIEENLDELKEHAEITRDGVNSLLEWAEECGNVIKFPLPKVK